MKNNIMIINPVIAKRLIKQGFRVVDITENKKERNKTIFYFERNIDIKEFLEDKYNFTIS